MMKLSDRYNLRNGYGIPCIGFGTWQTPDGETATLSVKTAIESGYRHIDCAAIYGNEESVGQGINEGLLSAGISRDEIFVTSKAWYTELGYEKTLKAFEKTCKDLKQDYLDLYLIHWPADPFKFSNWEEINLDTWKAMMKLYKDGRVRAIGVSNFHPQHLKALMETEVRPMVDQIEFHPGQMQKDTVDYCRKNGILVEAWSPLGTGKMLSNELLKNLAEKYNRSVAQICIRWEMENHIIPLPKSKTKSRIIENTQVFDFEISDADMKFMNSLQYLGGSGLEPETFSI